MDQFVAQDPEWVMPGMQLSLPQQVLQEHGTQFSFLHSSHSARVVGVWGRWDQVSFSAVIFHNCHRFGMHCSTRYISCFMQAGV